MKINEKNLCAYATSSSHHTDKEGYLIKRGDGNKGFHKRWFVLKGNLLFYFDKRFDKEPIGVIILEGCTIELDEMDAQFCFKIVFHGMGIRSYILCAESQELMEQWMKALACASYDYMKLMVTELKRQLNQLGEATTTCCNHAHLTNTNGNNANNELITDSNSSFKSPLPPPRYKHVPPGKQTKTCNVSSRIKISFTELHMSYGRPVLRDRNEWKDKLTNNDQILITF